MNKNEVLVDAVRTPLNISRKNTNKLSNHSRTIINLHKYGNIGIIDLDFHITLKKGPGVSYDPVTTIFMVVYGVSGHQNNVDSGIWDRFYLIQNKVVKFEAGINMNKLDIINVHNLSINNLLSMSNKVMKGLGVGIEINVGLLNESESKIGTYVKAEIAKVDTSPKKKYFNSQLNNAIAEYGYPNSLICVFYLVDNQFNDGKKISKLPDKKIAFFSYDANQNTESRNPTADKDLNF